ncbi:putative reverse transcriptase domain-containing protein [Tanacetum coccineum]
MSTSKTYQQSLADAGSENRPPMLERGSYIPWASRFRRYLNRKRDNRKWLLKALDEGPYEFKNFVPEGSTIPRLQTAEDLEGDDLLLHDAEMEVMNMILLSIPNEIYNSVDACTSAKDMWKRVERLMRGTIQNKVDRETRFTNEFDQFVAEPGEALVSVYNRFAQLMNDLERNNMNFPTVTINIKFLNSLQPEWLKYVTQVRLAKQLTMDSFDDFFDYIQAIRELVNAFKSKEQDDVHNNSEDPLVSAMLLLAKAITQNFSNPPNNRLRASSNTRNQAIIQGRQRTLFENSILRQYFKLFMLHTAWKRHYARNCPKPRVRDSKYFMEQMLLEKQDEAGVILTDEQNDFLFAVTSVMEEIEEISITRPGDPYSAAIQFGGVTNAYQEAEKQRIFAQQVQTQNTHLTSQLEMYKERVRILENINKDNNYLNEFLEADERAKRYNKQAQSQLVRDRDIIRDLEKQRDKLDLEVKNFKRKNEELQKTHSILKRQMSEKEDTYHDTILDLEAKLKKNVDLILKLGNSLQGMFMLGPKPLSVYDQQLKHGLGYPNPYTLKQAISKCPKLYVASCLGNLEIPLNVRDSEDTLEDAFKSQQKMTEKMNDPIAVANKQNCWTINYKKLNALYKDFVPQKELSVEQKYFSSSSIPSVKIPVSKNMPSESPLIKELDKIKVGFEKLSLLIQKNCKRASIFYTSPAEIQINDFCQDQVKPILNELKVYLEFFQNLFQRDIKEMKDVFESTESELDELEKQNDLLKDQLLEASLKQDVELCVLINHECVDKILNVELEKVKKKSFEIQEGLEARIKILEKDVQRCEKQSVDFQLKLQHEKEKQKWDSTSKNKTTIPLDYSWISKLEKLKDENVSLDFIVQSLIKERDNAKMEYKKIFDSIKKTRSQTQKEMDELIVHVSEKTYAYGAIRAENQNLLSTISKLKTRLEKVEKGKSVNTKFDKTNGSQSLLCVTPLNKHAFQKKTDVSKREENHVVCLAWMLLIDLCGVYMPVPVMAISVISISSDSSEDSVGTPIGRTDTPVIPTETPIIAPTIPPSPDYTPASPDYSPASGSESDPSEDPSSDHIPPLPATSPFLSSDDDPTDSDTPDTPSSPTHDTPFTEITASTQRSPIIPRRRVMLLASGQPIPYGRPYRYHLNGPVHMMTARKRVGPLPTHRLAERHPTDHSSSDSSSEASSDFHSDASSDSSSRHSLSDHSSPDLPSTSAGPSRKRRRSPMTSVPALSPVSGALSPGRLILERLVGDDVIVRVSDEPHLEQDSDPEVQAEINECFAYADALRDRGIDARVVVEAIDRDETETGVRGPVEVRVERVTRPVMPEDIPEPAQEGSVEVTYETLGDLVQRFHDHTQAIPVHRIQTIEGVQREQGHRIVGVESAVMALTERIAELERDNRRLRGTMSVESQRVDRLQRGMSRMQRELRQMRRLRFYDRVRVGRLEAKMPSTRSGASMTREEFEELVARRVAEELDARETARTLEPLNENGDELEGENGGNGNGNGGNGNGNGGNGNGNGNGGNGNGNGGNGNGGNGNRNGNHGMNYGGFMPVARECTFQDFLKCKPHNFSGTEGVVGLTRWFEKMETVFNISNCPLKYQVKYATCTLQDSALTWFQELILLCTRMVPDEEDRVERFIGGLPDNIQGNVIAANPARLQDAIRIANQLMDKKVQGYAARSAENKRRMESNLRDNRGQQPPFKRQNTSGQNVARAYTAGNNERKGYAGPLPYCNKCRLHHEGLCTMRCGNCKKVGHQTRDCRAAIAPNTQRAPVGNQQGIICYECGRPGHFRKDCPKLRNQNRGNQTRNKNGNKTGNRWRLRNYGKKLIFFCCIGGGGNST